MPNILAFTVIEVSLTSYNYPPITSFCVKLFGKKWLVTDWFSFVLVLIIPWLEIRSALEGECGFLAANLYAKSVFGEDALVNVSIEKQTDGKLGGYIRIRSKTQGIALSLGDKITLKQKGGT